MRVPRTRFLASRGRSPLTRWPSGRRGSATMIHKLLLLGPVAVLATLSCAHAAREDEAVLGGHKNGAAVIRDFPTKPVHLIEPFGAGGGPDLIARALAHELSELWGQPV